MPVVKANTIVKAANKVLRVSDNLAINTDIIRLTATITKTIDIYFETLNSDKVVLETPQGKLVGTRFNFDVVVGDVVKMSMESGNWSNLKRFNVQNTGFKYAFVEYLDKIENAYYFKGHGSTPYTTTDQQTMPANAEFPNCIDWYRIYLITDITASTFSSDIERVDNIKMTIPVNLLTSPYSKLRNIGCYPYGDFQNLPIDNYGNLYFSDTAVMTGDPGVFLNALNSAGYGISRPGFASYGSDVIVDATILMQKVSINGSWQQIKINASTIMYQRPTITCYKAVGTIVAFAQTAIDNATQGVQMPSSIIDGDVGVWRNYGWNIQTAHFGVKIQGTRILSYTKDQGTDGVDKIGFAAKQFYWYDCAADKDYGYIGYSEITEQTLIDLVDDKHYYVVNNDQQYGLLHIGSNNPAITDQTALWQIEQLTTPVGETVTNASSPYYGLPGYGWTIYVNT